MSKRTEADRKYFLTSVTHEHVHKTVLNVFGFDFLQLKWDVAPKIEHGRKLADVLRVIMWLHDGERLHGLDLNLRDLFLCFPTRSCRWLSAVALCLISAASDQRFSLSLSPLLHFLLAKNFLA